PQARPDTTNRVRLSSTFQNDNWFPLSKTEMQAAAVDAALSELTREGAFVFVDQQGGEVGDLHLKVSLVEAAALVKISMTLDLPGVSYVATAATSLQGLNRQSIYRAFEHVGTTAAQRLRLNLGESDETGFDKTENLAAKTLYENAQRLKSAADFDHAAQLFAALQRNHPNEDKWRILALDELRYGLPLFEAKYRITELGRFSSDPMQAFEKIDRANQLFRQILAENSDDITRIQETQRHLDALSISQRALQNSIEAQSLAYAGNLKIFLMTYYAERGEWPKKQDMTAMLKTLPVDFEIQAYHRNGGDLQVTLVHQVFKTRLLLTSNKQGHITLQVKRDL
ncbi:MAG: hypothetical protein GXO96_01570, partial [Nitrospirae bacterium]|nr:hypothetical protein [Candidatus Manganitrophaceae bacterium]